MQRRFSMARRLAAPNGFSFIEAIFAISILAFGAVGLLTLLSNVIYTNFQEEVATIAVHLAEERVERVAADKASQGYAAIANSLYPSPETVTRSGLNFTRSTNIYEVSETDLSTSETGSKLKRVDVTVTAPSQFNQTVKVSYLLGSYL